MRSARTRPGARAILGATCVALGMLAAAASAPAATHTYPAGGGTFTGSAQGWQVGQERCDLLGTIELGLLCSATGGFDPAQGNPPGSLAMNVDVTVNLLTAFKASATFESPEFTVAEGGAATLHLDRQFEPGGLFALTPNAGYGVTLENRTTGGESSVLQETVGSGAATFAGKDAVVSLVAGHTYAVRIDVEVASTAKLALGGAGSVRFDNVSLSLSTAGGGDDKGGGGSGKGGNRIGGVSSSRLLALFRSTAVSPATLKGKRLFVKVGCPARVGRACRITAQGLLAKGRPATAKRTVKVGKGKGRQIVLRVRPRARPALAKRRVLLVRERVRAGKARATIHKKRKLIRR